MEDINERAKERSLFLLNKYKDIIGDAPLPLLKNVAKQDVNNTLSFWCEIFDELSKNDIIKTNLTDSMTYKFLEKVIVEIDNIKELKN